MSDNIYFENIDENDIDDFESYYGFFDDDEEEELSELNFDE
ncbi:MAG: hypothetical protein ACOCZ5_01280 [bacterium]